MSSALKETDRAELVNLQRLAHLLKGLSPAELETLQILLDEEARETITQSLKELDEGKGLPIVSTSLHKSR
jgi:DNA replication protein DnaD